MIRLIDTHAHLDQVDNIETALKEASAAGVEGVVAVGIDLAANKKNFEIKKKTKNPKIFLAFGVHPETLENANPDSHQECFSFIKENINEAVAIGEIGLDYWYKWVKKDEDKKREQREIFEQQLYLAQEFDKPVIIHSRGSWQDCLDMTKNAGIKKAVFHWYSGPVNILGELIDCGYFISAGPALSYSPQHKEAVLHAPIANILIETDSPVFYPDASPPQFLADWVGVPTCEAVSERPAGQAGFRAGPKDVFRSLKLCAALKNIDEERAAEIFYTNAVNFFHLNTLGG